MTPLRSVTVYCSSSRHVDDAYFAAARALGASIARNGWQLVYGGNNIGLMDAVASSVRSAGGRVVGITPQLMVDQGISDPLCDELVVTAGMRERKQLLEQRGDAFVTLPGGLGTFEELFEVLVARILGYHDKPIVILNVNGYYAPLVAMLEHGIAQRFIKPKARATYFVANDVAEAIHYLQHHGTNEGAAPGPAAEPSAME